MQGIVPPARPEGAVGEEHRTGLTAHAHGIWRVPLDRIDILVLSLPCPFELACQTCLHATTVQEIVPPAKAEDPVGEEHRAGLTALAHRRNLETITSPH